MTSVGDIIEDAAGLGALADGTAVVPERPAEPVLYQSQGDGLWGVPGVEEMTRTEEIRLPARVIYIP